VFNDFFDFALGVQPPQSGLGQTGSDLHPLARDTRSDDFVQVGFEKMLLKWPKMTENGWEKIKIYLFRPTIT